MGLLARKGNLDEALPHYEAAVRLNPDFSRAQPDLGATLAAKGDIAGAIRYLREAAKASDSRIARQAADALRQLGANP